MSSFKNAQKYQTMLDHGEAVREDIINFFEGYDDKEKPLFADGFDYAIIGVGDSMYPQYNSRIVYDYNMCEEVLQIRDGMTREEANEFMEYNVTGAYVGPLGPVFLHRDSGLVTIKPAKKSKVKRPPSTNQLELPLVIEVL